MSKWNSATMYIDFIYLIEKQWLNDFMLIEIKCFYDNFLTRIQIMQFHVSKNHNTKRFVDFPQIDILRFHSDLL